MSNDIIIKVSTDYIQETTYSLSSDYPIQIDYGDGTPLETYNGTIEHTYPDNDEYTIRIKRVQNIGDDFLYDSDLANAVIEITIPHQITTIGNNFGFCPNLTKINLPNSLTSVGEWFLSGCENLTHIDLPNTLTGIGANFLFYTGITSITIPKGIKKTPNNFCAMCLDLTSININDGLEEIGDGFCISSELLINIHIPSTVKKIGNFFLTDMSSGYRFSLEEITFHSETPPTVSDNLNYWLQEGYSITFKVPQGTSDIYGHTQNYPDIDEYQIYEEYPTLKASIQALDTRIKNNLRTKGVQPNNNDGLTTLINRISDIDDGKNHGFLADIGFYDEDNWNETTILFEDNCSTDRSNEYTKIDNNCTFTYDNNGYYVLTKTNSNGTSGVEINTTQFPKNVKITVDIQMKSSGNIQPKLVFIDEAQYTGYVPRLTYIDGKGSILNGNFTSEGTSITGDVTVSQSLNKWYTLEFVKHNDDLTYKIYDKDTGTLVETLNGTGGVTFSENANTIGMAVSYDTGEYYWFKNLKVEKLSTGPMTILKDRLIFPNNATFSFNNISFPNTFTWNFIAHIKYPEDTIKCSGQMKGSSVAISNKIDYEFLISITRQNGGDYSVICETTGDEFGITDLTLQSLTISPYNSDDPIVITDIYFSEEYEDNDYEKIYYNVVWDLTSTNYSSFEIPVLLLKNGKPYYEYLITEESQRLGIIDGLSIPLLCDDGYNSCWGVYHYKRTDDTNTYSWTTPKQYGLKAYDDDPYSSICYNETSENRADFHANGKIVGCECFEESNYSKNTQTPSYISQYYINDYVNSNFGLSFEYIANENEENKKTFEISWTFMFNQTFRFYYDGSSFKLQEPTSHMYFTIKTLDIPYSSHMYFTIYRFHSYNSWDLIITANDQRNFYEYTMSNNWGEPGINLETVTFDENCEIRKFYHWNIEEGQS